MFKAPGNLQELDSAGLRIWNDMIKRQFDRSSASRFLKSNPQDVENGFIVDSVRWSGAPAEPKFCINREWALKLSDWGVRGRHGTQNEYCEYNLVTAIDSNGRVRPKRVVFTTELREYWVLLAQQDPEQLKEIIKNILGREVSWQELYNHTDPLSLNNQQRKVAFSTMVAGNGYDRDLSNANVPVQPLGSLNRDNALFMTHPINGLDDLIYIVAFGSVPYVVNDSGIERKALLQEIFREASVEQLACRNADPAAAAGAFDAVSEGREISFAENLGMYIRPLNIDNFEYNNNTIPEEWIKYSRGQQDMYQRLEFGPSDEEEVYLDDIYLKRGAAREEIIGGYQIAELLEVGPLVIVSSQSSEVKQSDKVLINASTSSISCRQARVCVAMNNLKSDYEDSHSHITGGVRGIN